MIELAENRYGKSRVRLMKVTRSAGVHDLFDWTVEVLLRGDFAAAHKEGDNSRILATDTMKNTVYSLARRSSARSMEEFAKELIDFLLERNAQVDSAEVSIRSALWKRLSVDGSPDPTTFMRGSAEEQTTRAERAQGGRFRVTSGLDHLAVLKTANSGFSGFIRDELTTLPETDDRLLGTAMRSSWVYGREPEDFGAVRNNIRETMLRTFALHKSRSVQETMYAMGEAALNAVSAIDEIELAMPNKHCLLVDLSRFGQDNPNEIFVPTDEPHGYIEARLRRRSEA